MLFIAAGAKNPDPLAREEPKGHLAQECWALVMTVGHTVEYQDRLRIHQKSI